MIKTQLMIHSRQEHKYNHTYLIEIFDDDIIVQYQTTDLIKNNSIDRTTLRYIKMHTDNDLNCNYNTVSSEELEFTT